MRIAAAKAAVVRIAAVRIAAVRSGQTVAVVAHHRHHHPSELAA
jgi:hypothetical protein